MMPRSFLFYIAGLSADRYMAERFEVFVPALNGFLIRNPEAVFGQVKLGTFVVSQRVIGQQIHLPNPGKVFR